jgi:radical SAM superfamily enzyme YgiQ (UPF0313 family)
VGEPGLGHDPAMRYEGDVYRPPSEADSWILQATVGCSWNACTYCSMYRAKKYRARPLPELLDEVAEARERLGPGVDKVFVADGDALGMDTEAWLPLLRALHAAFPRLRRVSCYAMARNILAKGAGDLRRLREAGLSLLYIGPESGDPATLRRIAKGGTFEDHAEAARLARAAGMKLSAIFLLGAGGTARSREHAEGSARLATAMDPRFLSCLTLTVVPGTPLATLEARGGFELPGVEGLLAELRTFVAAAAPADAIFRTNHASNYLPLAGRLPKDRGRILSVLDAALAGEIRLRPEWSRGL